jgi:hypothetical protein
MGGDQVDDDDKARLDREQRIRRTIYAYKRVFASPDGRIVLEDLRKSFGVDMPAYIPTNTRPGGNIQYDDIYGKLRDGQRHVWIHITNAINSPLEPEGNLEEPFEVVTGVRG